VAIRSLALPRSVKFHFVCQFSEYGQCTDVASQLSRREDRYRQTHTALGIYSLPTNTVTHVLGVRAFGTQLLCEQVIGRAIRRQSYDLNEENLFTAEYADVLGIPFDFNAKPVIPDPQPPRETIVVKAVNPDRDHLEIRFPRVAGYRKELPDTRFDALWMPESHYTITPADVGPSQVINSAIIGETAELNTEHLKDVRKSSLIFGLTN
jgi:type III restriction enzyme